MTEASFLHASDGRVLVPYPTRAANGLLAGILFTRASDGDLSLAGDMIGQVDHMQALFRPYTTESPYLRLFLPRLGQYQPEYYEDFVWKSYTKALTVNLNHNDAAVHPIGKVSFTPTHDIKRHIGRPIPYLLQGGRTVPLRQPGFYMSKQVRVRNQIEAPWHCLEVHEDKQSLTVYSDTDLFYQRLLTSRGLWDMYQAQRAVDTDATIEAFALPDLTGDPLHIIERALFARTAFCLRYRDILLRDTHLLSQVRQKTRAQFWVAKTPTQIIRSLRYTLPTRALP